MTRNLRIAVALLGLLLTAPSVSSLGQEPKAAPAQPKAKAPSQLDKLMRKKLQHSQKVLEGVALNDLEMVAEHARELMTISKAVEFQAVKTRAYELNSNRFRR